MKQKWEKSIELAQKKMKIVPKELHHRVGWSKLFGYSAHSKVTGFLESVNPKTGNFINKKHATT